jgi:2-oxoglutarate dehydrogenase E1 component
MFHLLRRHLKWNIRVPLIVFTPKSLLRHPMVTCTLEELSDGHFKELIDDRRVKPQDAKQLVFTSGRLYYDLVKKRNETGANTTAIVRLEQLYPLPMKQIEAVLEKYNKAERIIWAQDEPENMGAWPFIFRKLNHIPFELVARSESGSPAGGLMKQHTLRLNKLLAHIFDERVLA